MKTGKGEQSQKSKDEGGRGGQWEEMQRGMEEKKQDKEGGVRMENSVGVWFMPGELCVSRWGCLLIP